MEYLKYRHNKHLSWTFYYLILQACKISPNGSYTEIGQSDTVEFSHDDNGNLSLVMTLQDGDNKM